MRKVIAAGCAGAVAMTLAGCGAAEVRDSSSGGGQEGGPIELAVVPKAIGFDFWESVRLGAQCAVSQQRGVEMQWDGVTQETDVSGQQNLLQNLITQGVDGLVYAATDARALSDVSRSALDSGTTVVNIDSGTQPQPEQVPVYATDNVAAAEMATQYLADQLGGRGKVAFVPFQPGTATNDTRTEGFMNGLRANPGLQLVAQQSSDSDYNQALQVTQDILTANPDLDGIYAANEPSVLGAAEAARQAGKAGQVTIVGWDTASAEIEGIREGVISAVVAQNPFGMGFQGVNAAVQQIRTGRPAPGGDTGAKLITRDNVDSPDVASLLNPSCQNPPRID
jgi:ribose transport system substrate-binding protein